MDKIRPDEVCVNGRALEEAGAGVHASAASAAAPPEARIVWDKVRSPEHHKLIEDLTRAYPRRTRKEKRAFAVLAKRAGRLGLLEAVPKEEQSL